MSGSTSYLPAIPDPVGAPVPALLDACAAVVAWADTCEDFELVREVYDRMAAIAEYLARQEHARSAQAAMRRIEVRLGELSGPAEHGGDRKSDQVPHEVLDLPKNRTHEFRKMAANPEVVEEVIAESTEQSPPSRNKVLNAIRDLETAARAEKAEWKAGLAEDRAWAKTVKAKPGDDWQRRSRTQQQLCGLISACDRFLAAVTSDDLAHALATGFPHVSDVFREDLNRIIPAVHAYWEATR